MSKCNLAVTNGYEFLNFFPLLASFIFEYLFTFNILFCEAYVYGKSWSILLVLCRLNSVFAYAS